MERVLISMRLTILVQPITNYSSVRSRNGGNNKRYQLFDVLVLPTDPRAALSQEGGQKGFLA